MKSVATLVALLICASLAFAAGPEAGHKTYVLISQIGESVTVVTHRSNTSTRIDQNEQETIVQPDAAFDRAALLAMDDAVRKADPSAKVVMLAPSSATLRASQGSLVNGQRFVSFEALDEALKKADATRVLLVVKYRAPAAFETGLGKPGSGMLEGLGFYIDREFVLIRSDTGERGVGFLAPYAYFKVVLVDVATSTVLKEQAVTATTTRSAARSKDSFDPWDAMSPTEKATFLRGMIRREILKTVPALMQAQ